MTMPCVALLVSTSVHFGVDGDRFAELADLELERRARRFGDGDADAVALRLSGIPAATLSRCSCRARVAESCRDRRRR